ncbi:Palmitoyltransferase AKR1 [Diplonema papillatum]|nr:Palmitoyltransferase AKR1 [Diplonema papillatum]
MRRVHVSSPGFSPASPHGASGLGFGTLSDTASEVNPEVDIPTDAELLPSEKYELLAQLAVASRDDPTRMCLNYAAFWNRESTAQLLLHLGESVAVHDANGDTPLHWAARGGAAEITEWLLAAGADPKRANHAAQTAEHVALSLANRKIAHLLASHVTPTARRR